MVGRFSFVVLLACLAATACRADREEGAIRRLLDATADTTANANGARADTNTLAITTKDPFTGSSIGAGFARAAGRDPTRSTASTGVDVAANTGPNAARVITGSTAAGKETQSVSAGAAATNPFFGFAGGLTSASGTGPNSQAAAGNFLAATSLPSTSAATANTAAARGTDAAASVAGNVAAGRSGAATDFTALAKAGRASSIVNGVAASGLPAGGVSSSTGGGSAIVIPGFASGFATVDARGIPTFVQTNIKTESGGR